jgi:hypothetical protein
LIFSFALCVLARPPGPVNVIRAFTVTLPFFFSLLFAVLVRASCTVIVGGLPDALDAEDDQAQERHHGRDEAPLPQSQRIPSHNRLCRNPADRLLKHS